tara:strand:+ start:55 stop:291 length:237 start_codon:yes stop_codon:yes gene_type:complete
LLNANKEVVDDKKYEPTNPEYVLFGLILVNFFPLKILPNINPPMSVVIQTNMIKYKKIFSSALLDTNKSNITEYKITK